MLRNVFATAGPVPAGRSLAGYLLRPRNEFATTGLVPVERSLAGYKPISEGPTGTRPVVAKPHLVAFM